MKLLWPYISFVQPYYSEMMCDSFQKSVDNNDRNEIITICVVAHRQKIIHGRAVLSV